MSILNTVLSVEGNLRRNNMEENKRLITKKFLKSCGFKYDDKRKLWCNRFSYPDQYKWETLKYDYENRVLHTQESYVIGADDPEVLDEEMAYEWIKHIGRGLLVHY